VPIAAVMEEEDDATGAGEGEGVYDEGGVGAAAAEVPFSSDYNGGLDGPVSYDGGEEYSQQQYDGGTDTGAGEGGYYDESGQWQWYASNAGDDGDYYQQQQ
jgi:hypothetical protein